MANVHHKGTTRCMDPRHLNNMHNELFSCANAVGNNCRALSDTVFKEPDGRRKPCPFFKTVKQAIQEGGIPAKYET